MEKKHPNAVANKVLLTACAATEAGMAIGESAFVLWAVPELFGFSSLASGAYVAGKLALWAVTGLNLCERDRNLRNVEGIATSVKHHTKWSTWDMFQRRVALQKDKVGEEKAAYGGHLSTVMFACGGGYVVAPVTVPANVVRGVGRLLRKGKRTLPPPSL